MSLIMNATEQEILKLSKRIVKVLKVQANKGNSKEFSNWIDFQNGLGQDVGVEIEKLISHAESKIKKYS
jgi:hypothetical protein